MKFESFWTAINQCPYELPLEIKPFLQNALKASGFYDTPVVSSGSVVTKTKKLSGYNLYMREKMAELKAENVPSGERMGKVSVMWKTLNEEDKAVYKTRASALVGTVTTKKTVSKVEGGVKKLSGYQLYVRETMPVVKADTTIGAKERMGAIGKLWKALSKETQGEWKVKADV